MRLVLFALFSSLVAAQQQPAVNTVSATVSLNQPAAAGTATFRIQFLDAGLNASLETALSVLGASGVAASHLVGTSVSLNQGFVITQYDFNLPVAVGQFGATRDRIIAAQRTLANVSTQGLSWSAAYAPTDEETAKALQQALPGLLGQARTQAAALAAAMEKTLGSLVGLSTPAVAVSGLNLVLSLTATYAVQ